MSSKPLKIVIEGNVGCGKSTLISSLEEMDKIKCVPEPVDKW